MTDNPVDQFLLLYTKENASRNFEKDLEELVKPKGFQKFDSSSTDRKDSFIYYRKNEDSTNLLVLEDIGWMVKTNFDSQPNSVEELSYLTLPHEKVDAFVKEYVDMWKITENIGATYRKIPAWAEKEYPKSFTLAPAALGIALGTVGGVYYMISNPLTPLIDEAGKLTEDYNPSSMIIAGLIVLGSGLTFGLIGYFRGKKKIEKLREERARLQDQYDSLAEDFKKKYLPKAILGKESLEKCLSL